MSFQSRLANLHAELKKDIPNSYHYWRANLQPPFLVWAEDGEGSALHTDDEKSEQSIHGTIDYFTKTEFDTTVDTIQNTLNGLTAWRLNSVQYEEDTNTIHYEWEFEV